MNRLNLILTALLVVWWLPLHADSMSDRYEKPVCVDKSKSPYGNFILRCGESPTIKKLKVELSNTHFSGMVYTTRAKIVNTNQYAVHLITIAAMAENKENQVIGFCSRNIDMVLMPKESNSKSFSCDLLSKTNGIKDTKISKVEVKASPWD